MFSIFLVAVFSYLLPICEGKLGLKNLKTYKKYSYTTFEPWSLHGELTFVFRTNQSNGLLIYQDDGLHDFIELFIENGNVRLKIGMGDCQIQEKTISGRFQDFHWHRLRLTRKPGNVTLSVDTSWATLPCSPARLDYNGIGGRFLYVASFPPTLGLNLNWLVFPGTFHQAMQHSFQGCLGDLWFTNNVDKLERAEVRMSSGTFDGCHSACVMPKLNKCLHGGQCVDEIGRVECQCQGTGYEGATCSRESSSASFTGDGYVSYDVGQHQPGRSTLTNKIAFRFATGSPDGVIVHTSMDDDHVVLELSQGFLRVSWDLGQGLLNITSREGCLHDGTWHSVFVHRKRRRVTLDVDDQKRITAVIPGDFSFLDFKGGQELLLFCGGPSPDLLVHSKSRANFTGIIQQLRFDEYKIIDEVFTHRIHKEFIAVGHVVNASEMIHRVPNRPLPLPNCTRMATIPPVDPCGAGVDDEDLCEMAASGLGPDHPGCDSTDGKCAMLGTDEKEGLSVITIAPKPLSASTPGTKVTTVNQPVEASSSMRTAPVEEEVITLPPATASDSSPSTISKMKAAKTNGATSDSSTQQVTSETWGTPYYWPSSSQIESEFLPTPALPSTTQFSSGFKSKSEVSRESFHRIGITQTRTERPLTRTQHATVSMPVLTTFSADVSLTRMRSNSSGNVTMMAHKSAAHTTGSPLLYIIIVIGLYTFHGFAFAL